MAVQAWRPSAPGHKYGIAICDFAPLSPECLRLNFGDAVQILEENGDWCRGHLIKKGIDGIFPTNHIHFKECVVYNEGEFESVTPTEDPVAREVTDVLREWGIIMKEQFRKNQLMSFEKLNKVLEQLVQYRQQILLGTLSADRLAALKSSVTQKIDWGNRELKLDLIPRNERGEVIDAEKTSVGELYRIHEKSAEEEGSSLAGSIMRKGKKATSTLAHLVFRFRTLACSIGEETHAIFTLYDADDNVFISDSYVVRLSATGFPHGGKFDSMVCVFSELSMTRSSKEPGGGDTFRNIYLVCYLYRHGAMELGKEIRKGGAAPMLRRPAACAVTNLTDLLARAPASNDEVEVSMTLYRCEDDSFHELHRLIIQNAVGKISPMEKAKGSHCAVRLLYGDYMQVKKENPLIFTKGTHIARKRGFPDVIMPGDVRNDLYVTLCNAEFERGQKKAGRNVEVEMSVLLDDGQVLSNCVSMGTGEAPLAQYNSTIYYHSNSPHWNETVKVDIPIELFERAHLRFYFRHCSSTEPRDKNAIFGFTFLPLMQRDASNSLGTTIEDGLHKLPVFRYDTRFDTTSAGGVPQYLTNPSQLQTSDKELFVVETLACSTKLTQNPSLLNLLKWRMNMSNVQETVRRITYVKGEEVVKFLTDIFDAVFAILDSNSNLAMDVFDALAHLIGVLAEKKFHNFRPVLDAYIERHFSGAMVHRSLVQCLRTYLERAGQDGGNQQLRLALKALEYIFKLIVQSRVLYLRGGKRTDDFRQELKPLFLAFNALMRLPGEANVFATQNMLLQNFASVFTDLHKFYSMGELGQLASDFLLSIPAERARSSEHKLRFIHSLVKGQLFAAKESRCQMLKSITLILKDHIDRREGDLDLCFEILQDMLNVLYADPTPPPAPDSPSQYDDLLEVIDNLLRSLIAVAPFIKTEKMSAELETCVLAILRQMSEWHYKIYLSELNQSDKFSFLRAMFQYFQSLVTRSCLPRDWVVMRMLQNDVILKTVQPLSDALTKYFLKESNFDFELWKSFFVLSVAYLCQSDLQLQNFSDTKRDKIVQKHGDKRTLMAYEISEMWKALGPNQTRFIPELVGTFQEMALVPEPQLRKLALPIFFDMMEHEVEQRGNFLRVEDTITDKLDQLVSEGRGDMEYRQLFETVLLEKCQKSRFLHIQQRGPEMVKSITDLTTRLLHLRNVPPGDDYRDERASCMYDLLRFYQSSGRPKMYMRYIHKLTDIHLQCGYYTEAALTLRLHADQLQWTDEVLPPYHDDSDASSKERFPQQTHRERKAQIYRSMIDFLDKGLSWENAIPLCKELAHQYEMELFDYRQLTEILRRQALFCEQIINAPLPVPGQPSHGREPQYFRVGYFGCGFPPVVRNREFIVRTRSSDPHHVVEFTERVQSQYPAAQLWKKTTPPDDKLCKSNDMYIMIMKVTPIPSERPPRFFGRDVPPQLLSYYEQNEVRRFFFTRPFLKVDKGQRTDNEFETLWIERCVLETEDSLPGLLNRSLVVGVEKTESSPIENAVAALEEKNRSLCQLLEAHSKDPTLNINALGMGLNGVIDAAVNGGTEKYRAAFLGKEYLAKNPQHASFQERLEQLMVDQLTILEEGIKVHSNLCPESLRPFHVKMETQLKEMTRKGDQFTSAKRLSYSELPYVGGASSPKSALSVVASTPKRPLESGGSTSSLPVGTVSKELPRRMSGVSVASESAGVLVGGAATASTASAPSPVAAIPASAPAGADAAPPPPPRQRTVSVKTNPMASPGGAGAPVPIGAAAGGSPASVETPRRGTDTAGNPFLNKASPGTPVAGGTPVAARTPTQPVILNEVEYSVPKSTLANSSASPSSAAGVGAAPSSTLRQASLYGKKPPPPPVEESDLTPPPVPLRQTSLRQSAGASDELAGAATGAGAGVPPPVPARGVPSGGMRPPPAPPSDGEPIPPPVPVRRSVSDLSGAAVPPPRPPKNPPNPSSTA